MSRRFKKILDRDNKPPCDLSECKKIFLRTFSGADKEEKFDDGSIKSGTDSTSPMSMNDMSLTGGITAGTPTTRPKNISMTEEHLDKSWQSSILNMRHSDPTQGIERHSRASKLRAAQRHENKLMQKLHTKIISAADDLFYRNSNGSLSNTPTESSATYLPKIQAPTFVVKRNTEKELNDFLATKSSKFWRWLSNEVVKLPGVEARSAMEEKRSLKLPKIDIDLPSFALHEKRLSLTKYSQQYYRSSIERHLPLEVQHGISALHFLRKHLSEKEFSKIWTELSQEKLSLNSIKRLQEAFSKVKDESQVKTKK